MSGIMEVREFQERYRNRKMNKTGQLPLMSFQQVEE